MNQPLDYEQGGGEGTLTVQFQATVNGAPTGTVIENTAGVSFGDAPPVDEDTSSTLLLGSNRIEGNVFEDIGAGYGNGSKQADETNTTLPANTVEILLYFDPTPNDDSSDWIQIDSTYAATDGTYSFGTAAAGSGLPDGDFVVEIQQTALPSSPVDYTGWTLTSGTILEVDLDSGGTNPNPVTSTDNDYGFAPALALDKTIVTPTPLFVGQDITFEIDVDNLLPGDGTAGGGFCQYEIGAGLATTGDTWINLTAAQGNPDGLTAVGVMGSGQTAVELTGTNYSLAGANGTSITDIQLFVDLYLDADFDTKELLIQGRENGGTLFDVLNLIDAGSVDALNIEGLTSPVRLLFNVNGHRFNQYGGGHQRGVSNG